MVLLGRRSAGWLAAFAAMALFAAPALALHPDEILKDAALEARARTLSAELRCLVCQNQSIDDSDAPLAKDLRVLVRERLQAGDSDQAVMDYIVARYGDFVLLKPPVNSHTLLLWIAPLFVLGGAIWIARRTLSGSAARSGQAAVLSPGEEAQLTRILEDKGQPPERGG